MRIDRGVEHDCRTFRHQRCRFLDGKEDSLHVDIDRLIEELFGHLLEGDKLPDAGVHEQCVNSPKAILNFHHCCFDIRHFAGVGANGESSVADFFGGNLQSLLIPSGNCHLRSLLRVRPCNPQTNSTVATCDNGNFALKSLCTHDTPSTLNRILSIDSNAFSLRTASTWLPLIQEC